MTNRTRDLVQMAKAVGLDVIKHYQKDSRIFVDTRAANGVTRAFNITKSPNDIRGDVNERARMKRFVNENPAPTAPTPETPKRKTLTVKKADSTPISPDAAPAPAAAPVSTAAQELTQKEFYRLCSFVEQGEGPAQYSSLEAYAMRVSGVMGQTVSEDAIREAMDVTGTATPDRWLPTLDPSAVLIKEMHALIESLGHKPSADFKRLFASVA
ncbi:hypothetical protein [Paraburkholderia sp. C35]|uniref:hypothetical protein n=1 Tax=Paraburkholderia sp. C35 TaxID=2126993 RepID=UPI000D68AFF7|nr:hypothetical protein [Paraburkholderia sp. C35]